MRIGSSSDAFLVYMQLLAVFDTQFFKLSPRQSPERVWFILRQSHSFICVIDLINYLLPRAPIRIRVRDWALMQSSMMNSLAPSCFAAAWGRIICTTSMCLFYSVEVWFLFLREEKRIEFLLNGNVHPRVEREYEDNVKNVKTWRLNR